LYADKTKTANFTCTESTLREGEQFANAYFDLEAKIKIAKALDEFGVDCMIISPRHNGCSSRKLTQLQTSKSPVPLLPSSQERTVKLFASSE
jgi:hypothetical protein